MRRKSTSALYYAPEIAAIGAIVFLIWAGIFFLLTTQREGLVRSGERDTANLARAFEENTERVIAGADQIILALRSDFEQNKKDFDLPQWVASHSIDDQFRAQIAVIQKDGMSLASTASPTPVSVADREHFTVQRDAKTDFLFISRPVLGRSSKRWSIQLTRAIHDASGAFDGIVVVSVDCIDLSKFYQTLDLEGGFIALVGADGIVRAQGPMTTSTIGSNITGTPILNAATGTNSGTVWMSNLLDSGDRLVSFRHLRSYPLIVVVAFQAQRLLSSFYALRTYTLVGGLSATLLVIGLGLFWIKQRKRAWDAKQSLTLTLEHMSQGIVMVDPDGKVPLVNSRALELLRLPIPHSGDRRAGRDRRTSRETRQLVSKILAEGLLRQGDELQTIVYDDGTVIEGHRSSVPSGGMIQTVTDVTARYHAEQKVFQMAHFDHLTGLGNRAAFTAEIASALAKWEADGALFSVLCIDLDGFKKVNDTLGHDVGDELLRVTAARLCSVAGAHDYIARMGGDEFILLARELDSETRSAEIAAEIAKELKRPFTLGSQQIQIGGCVGVANCPQHGRDATTLLKFADIALYRAKSSLKDAVRIFDPQMISDLQEREALETDLRTAVERDLLDVFFQPQFRIIDMEVVGFEALVRWQDHLRGSVAPDKFIPLAEETGLIVQIGRFVLERACRAAVAWPLDLRIAVNISPVQFRDADFVTMVSEVLATTGLAPSRLELEITEGVLIGDEAQALAVLGEVRRLGVQIALDDFGTGFSSMRYLQRFPFDRIKMDRSFIQAQATEPKARAIFESVLLLGKRLQLGIIAEGVETEAQLAVLKAQGCSEVQGFLTGMAMPEVEVTEFLLNLAPNRIARDLLNSDLLNIGSVMQATSRKVRRKGYSNYRISADTPAV